jgi:hypothetical protein
MLLISSPKEVGISCAVVFSNGISVVFKRYSVPGGIHFSLKHRGSAPTRVLY